MKKMLLALIFVAGFVVSVAPVASAIDLFENCTDAKCGLVKDTSLQQGSASFKVKSIINMATYILGGVAVMMIVISALRMMLANGDANAIKNSRMGILWSVVGVVVAVLAFTIVNFIVNWNWLT